MSRYCENFVLLRDVKDIQDIGLTKKSRKDRAGGAKYP